VPAPTPTARRVARAQSLGSLKTEEKTNASAGSGRRPSGCRALSVNSAGTAGHNQQAGTQPADRTWNLGRGEQILLGPRLSPDRSAGLPSRVDGERSDRFLMESLILAQDERWRRASHMQVERGPTGRKTGEDLVANGCVTREEPVPVSGITSGNTC
jgi:hypothetical protein